jgi:hypothetical protein
MGTAINLGRLEVCAFRLRATGYRILPSEFVVVHPCSFHQLLAWKLGDIKGKKLVFPTPKAVCIVIRVVTKPMNML